MSARPIPLLALLLAAAAPVGWPQAVARLHDAW
jgi:hypothetical protein